MTILSNIAMVLVVACVAQLLLVADCQRAQGKRGKKDGRGSDRGNKERVPKPPSIQLPDQKEKEQKSPSVKGVFKGKFSTKDKTQCTWVATGEDMFTLGVNCKKGLDTFDCEYKARPAACPEYASRVKVYWKQIARSLKKQKALCKDPAAFVKAGMCKRAPKVAHFKLNNTPSELPESSTPSPPSSEGKACTAYQKQRAEEYCSTSWSSLCNLFFSMIQNEDC
ncbi:hypothetical protein SKAU_G00034630 [Synaphobranchus kaupii]|uniref:Fibroblast growth factor-binding protein 1 n=1 Tax=Synaphobranchus kaupii TaxID=118154 RepID=A0A9Q1GEI4_SYNKA|nr:hypothetical protein SKAU_G00034630 [Synaphobranchus kaupii]